MSLLLARSVAAQEPSRAEDPTYDPVEAKVATGSGEEIPAAEADLPLLEGEALQHEVPDLVVQTWPPPTRYIIAFGSHYPLQMLGVGLGVEIYPADFLRVDALWSPGLSGFKGYITFSQYAQVIVGLRVLDFGSFSWKTVTAPPNPKKPDEPTPPIFKASLPVAHAFLLELGMLTGDVPRLKCTANCASSTAEGTYVEPTYAVVDPQLFYPMAGVRYVASSFASSKRQPGIKRSFLVQVWAHLLYQPFNDSNEALLWSDHSEVERQRFGGQGGVSFPMCFKQCVTLSLTGGYLPAPASAMFGFGMGT